VRNNSYLFCEVAVVVEDVDVDDGGLWLNDGLLTYIHAALRCVRLHTFVYT